MPPLPMLDNSDRRNNNKPSRLGVPIRVLEILSKNVWFNGDLLSVSATTIKNWTAHTFGDLKRIKKCILARLKGIQNSPLFESSNFHQNLNHELTADYNSILKIDGLLAYALPNKLA